MTPLKTIYAIILIAGAWSLPLKAGDEDETVIKPRVYKLHLDACSRSNKNACRFHIDEAVLKKFGLGTHRKTLEVYNSGDVILTAKTFVLETKSDKDNKIQLWLTVRKGVWEISVDERKNLLQQKTSFLAMIYPKAKPALRATESLVAAPVPPATAITQENVPDRTPRAVFTKYSGEDSDAKPGNKRRINSVDEAIAAPDEIEPRKVAAVSPSDAKPTTTTFDRFEKWASGETSQKRPTIALYAKVGSPHSPTSQQGAQVEFYPNSIVHLGFGGGSYDSKTFLDKCAGAIKSSNMSLLSGLSIGNKGGSVDFGLGLTQINARYNAGTGLCAKRNNNEPLLKQDGYIAESYKKTYWGIAPSIGLKFSSAEFYMFTVDYGMFAPIGDKDFNGSPKGPFNPFASKTSKVSSAKSNWLSIGFGVGF